MPANSRRRCPAGSIAEASGLGADRWCCAAGHSGMVERELVRMLLATGSVAVARYLQWIVDGDSEAQVSVDMSWPAAPLVL